MYQEAQEHFLRLHQKMQHLLKLQEQKLREMAKMKEELSQLRKEKALQEAELALMQEKLVLNKKASDDMTETEKKELERKINQYIRDIDKAIAHINHA
jgi:septal ring factor EnvC (AmiA/AmiB activator)